MIKKRNDSLQIKDPWYIVNGQKEKMSPKNAIELGHLVPRDKQTTITRLKTGVLKTMRYKNKIKTYEQCPVHTVPANPGHIIWCLNITKQDLYDNPVMVADKLDKPLCKHIMELV